MNSTVFDRCRGWLTASPGFRLALALCVSVAGLPDPLDASAANPKPALLDVGIAVRDVTPASPVWLAGYAARNRPFERVDSPLLAQAVALSSTPGGTVVIVSLDNCEVSREFTVPVLRAIHQEHGLPPGRVMIISSHTHSAPVLDGPLIGMYPLSETDQKRVAEYGEFLQGKLIEVVGAALGAMKPASLEHGVGHARFAMNRRVYQGDKVVFGENADGPVDWDVPVLKIKGTDNHVRAILFGYACHGTSIAGEDFYLVSGDYMACAREHLEAAYPGTAAIYLTGMGADSNPSPRGRLLDAKRHGLELAGAVTSVMDRPMRPVSGPLTFAFDEAELPLGAMPARQQIETDAKSQDHAVRHRAQCYLRALDEGAKPNQTVKLPISVLRLGDDLTFVAMGGEVVVDYAVRLKRLLAAEHPWMIGYAYEVPCYIPSIRILMEGGYEAESSLIYYGLYGPLTTQVEDILIKKITDLLGRANGSE